jgi:hypothetical protein
MQQISPAARHDQSGFPRSSGGEEPVVNACVRTCWPFDRSFDTSMLLCVGQAYEGATDWHRHSPPL